MALKNLHISIIAMFFMVVCILASPPVSAAWWNNSWANRTEVTITGGAVTLTNFTVLLNVSYNSDMMANFSDLRFIDGSCSGVQTNILSFEFDKVINSNSVLVWLKIPSLLVGNNKICMYFKNSTATDGQDSLNTWDMFYKGVYHLTAGTGTNIIDSTGHGNGTFNGTNTWDTSGSIIGNAVKLDGTSFLNMSKNTYLKLNHPNITLEIWFNQTINTNPDYYGLFSGGYATNNFYFLVGPNGAYQTLRYGKIAGTEFNTDLSPVINSINYASWRDNVTGAFANLNKMENATTTISATTSDFIIGKGNSAGRNFIGVLDEIRISNISRSGAWINRSYDNRDFTMFYFGEKYINVTSQNYNATAYETSREGFSVNVNYNSTIWSLISANLIYNGVTYAGTKTGTGDNVVFYYNINIDSVLGSKSFYWAFTVTNSTTTAYETSRINTQTVNSIAFGLCNSTLNVPYLNYTFKDEETNGYTNATITSSFIYYLGDGTTTKTYSFQNTVENLSYAFCLTPTDREIYATPSIQYGNSISITRTYNAQSPLTFTNATTNTILYLLKTADGIYSSYQVIAAGSLSPISNALVNFVYNGNLIEQKLTDSSGLATFFLNPNFAYLLSASKSGFNSFTATIYPTQTSYTITLSSSSAPSNITSYLNGVTYTINPINSYLTNGTTYNFNVTLFSSYWNINSWGFNITNGTDSLYSTSAGIGGIGNLGTLSTNLNTNNYTSLTLNVFWTADGTLTSVGRNYIIESLSGSKLSISNLVTDFKSYVSSGFFGLTGIGLNLIIFVLIFGTTGILTYKFGLYSPAAISFIIFILVFIFDIGFGLIYYPTIFGNKAQHIATVIMGLITLALGIKEGTGY